MALDEESRALKRGTSGLAMDTSGNFITSSSDSKITTPSGIRLSGISNYGGSPMTSAKKPSFSQPVDSARPAGVVGDSGVTTTTATTAAAATAAHTAVPLSGEALADSAADIAAAQRDLLKTVQDQSEREFLDKAILGSLQVMTEIGTWVSNAAALVMRPPLLPSSQIYLHCCVPYHES
jgi:hypothetical protein